METARWTARVETFNPDPIECLIRFTLQDGPCAGHMVFLYVAQPAEAISDLIMGDRWTSPVGWRCVLEMVRPLSSTWSVVRIWNLAETRSLATRAPSDGLVDADAPLGPDLRTTIDALRHINRHRDLHALRRLDPEAAGWTAEDVVTEARRLGWRPA